MSKKSPTKRILMVCYHYPPSITAGVYRSLAFSLNLPNFGWQPKILTVTRSFESWVKRGGDVPSSLLINKAIELPLAIIVDLANAALGKIVAHFGKDLKTNYFREILCIPDAQISWCFWMKLIREARDVECVYVSCSPFSAGFIAALLKPLYKKPLILDFRDIWAINPRNPHLSFHKKISQWLEKFTISKADKIILNTKGTLALYLKKYPQFAEKMFFLPNGFDHIPSTKKLGASNEFIVMHVGSLYGKRDPVALMEALSELKIAELKFVQIGGSFEAASAFKDQLNIEIIPPVAHKEALEFLAKADLLYLNQGDDDTTAIAAKTFEYLASGLPILAECPEGDNAELLKGYGKQLYLVKKNDKQAIKLAINALYQQKERHDCEVSKEFIEKFNRLSLTKILVSIIELGDRQKIDCDFY